MRLTALPARLVLPVGLAAALLAGCSGQEEARALDPDVVHLQAGAPGEPNEVLTAAPAEDVFAGSPFSATDVEFMRGMQAHHEQALEMTALVPSRSGSEDLRLFVQRMDIAQTSELEQLQRLLDEHAALQERSGAAHDDHADGHGDGGDHADYHAAMPGMLSQDRLTELEAASGATFDRLFLEGMSEHHEGALAMVDGLLATEGAAADPRLQQLAQHVDSDQRIEIDRMARMHAALPPA
ncbi:DUF305 domain-containing protein [Aquipuribacter hungaricus]|uniref:DUF305 domain-containing protein n=1 Tax=Aquipuribacter hungaricus TaxID=545624 RepID=A0ABV7WES8_9MICO